MKVKVILLQDVPQVGDRDDVVEVAEGHARNFLIPQGFAVLATPEKLKAREARKMQEARAAEQELHTIQMLADRLLGFELTIDEKVSEGGTLYAAVTPQKIAEAFAAQGHAVQAKWILLPEPIKSTGEYDVQLEFPHGLEAMIKLIVISQSS